MSSIRLCTEPLPNEVVPTTSPRSRSWIAPATISEADALPPLTSTIMGCVSATRSASANTFSLEPGARPFVNTIRLPLGTKLSDTSTACARSPPGLSRRSTITERTPPRVSRATAWRTSSPVVSEKVDTRR